MHVRLHALPFPNLIFTPPCRVGAANGLDYQQFVAMFHEIFNSRDSGVLDALKTPRDRKFR